MTDIRATILDLVDGGEMDAEFALRCCLNWMSASNAQDMVNNMPDFEGYGLGDDDEETVDGTQFRYIIRDNSTENFSAEVYAIDSDGDDSDEPVYTVDAELYNNMPDIDWENAEEATDHFLRQHGLGYADHYLDEHDDVIMI